jgi:hypothetical protein
MACAQGRFDGRDSGHTMILILMQNTAWRTYCAGRQVYPTALAAKADI